MNTTANTAFAQREDYASAYGRAANELHGRLMREPRYFAEQFPEWDCAFMGLAEQMKLRAYGDPDRRKELERRITEETEEVTSLWCLWKLWHTDDKALTGNERNLGRWADRRVQEHVEAVATAGAEGDVEEVARLQRAGM